MEKTDKASEDKRNCPHCKSMASMSDDFCPKCGYPFKEEIFCTNHPKDAAEGACIICCSGYCSICGGWTSGLFLCAAHSDYEIYQGMARVYGISDAAQAQHAANCLEQAHLHPFLYSRKATQISLGGPEYTLFRSSGEYDGHIINEIKAMVPVQEVIRAEKILRDLDLSG
ncbi:MAG: hypothetical protein GTO42_01435 [Candidatus Latescibacteria bacterium]|nr:hypothetical protein [Candidatus Latescibacterota bacterium]NIO27192.1 hypothetical protein [Candidatus Latescibacterota bacterium]NIO54716.1 hypothetical protein [Candidatus Latescibacterota bacterium]NIT00799.1 hypothetical protein [Candidatus Latescibacterota bacterium]NIT37722.1 hypothetical protein [Candidatus Latescibacterota bacterium]